MILRDLYLYPDLVEFNGHPLLARFRNETRCLCNFVGRRVAREKFSAPFSRICVIGRARPNVDCFVNSSNVLVVEVPLTTADFVRLDDVQPDEYFIGLLHQGLGKVAMQHDIPLTAFEEGIEDFRNAGYRNEWVWKRKQPKGLGLTLSFDCALTMKRFELRLRVYRKNTLVLEDLVLATIPDEICFVPDFKRVEFQGSTVVVLNHTGRVTYSRDLTDLTKQASA